MTAVLAILRGVPVWVYVIVAAMAWGGIQHRRAASAGETLRQAQAAAAAEEAQALRSTIAETERRLSAQQEIASAAQAKADTNARAAAAARATADRVRSAAAAYAASAAASNPATAGDRKADRLSELFGQCVEALVGVAEAADRSILRGQACERAYGSLTDR